MLQNDRSDRDTNEQDRERQHDEQRRFALRNCRDAEPNHARALKARLSEQQIISTCRYLVADDPSQERSEQACGILHGSMAMYRYFPKAR
jgi:hypothetical protein